MNRIGSLFSRVSPMMMLDNTCRFIRKLTRTKGNGLNTHRSSRAKRGLYHGKDIRFGNQVSHSQAKTRRSWHPNVFKKRVWSFALDNWIRFPMTTTAMKKIDDYGGIDNYLLSLDEKSVQDSAHITRSRDLIAAILYHKGELAEKFIRKFKFRLNPPPFLTAPPKELKGKEKYEQLKRDLLKKQESNSKEKLNL